MTTFVSRFAPAPRLQLALLALGVCAMAVPAHAASNRYVSSGLVTHAQNLGLEAPGTKLNLTVWLNLHNQSELDSRVAELYKPGSPTFHQWLTNAELAKYAPTAAEVAAVEKELAAHHLQVTYKDALGFGVRFSGTVADVESAFGVKVNKYALKGKLVHTTSAEPQLGGAAAGLMHHLGGLNSAQSKPLYTRPVDPKTKLAFAGVPVAKGAQPNGVYFASQCFYAPSTTKLTGVNANDGVTPVSETLSGLNYGANPANTANGTLAPCGYSAAQVQGFYGLTTAYGKGFNGAGQTVVILDEGTNAQALPDANIFNSIEKLPAFTSANYVELNPFNYQVPASVLGADVETDLDVEWAHAVAPGAKIALIDVGEDNEDFQAAELYAVENHLGNVISVSYGGPEYYNGPLDIEIFGEVAELAAASGISLDVSSGDSGDFLSEGLPAPDTNALGDSPWHTSVGGTSIGTDPASGTVYTLGWGNNINQLTFGTGFIADPPTGSGYFYAGSGGGASQYWSKPAFESSLPGSQRLIPDVSALADPYTGAEFVYDDGNGNALVGAIGGTSLAAPIFSGMWAILNETAGFALGQAAPYIAQAPSPLITDVLPLAYPQNLVASVTDPSGTTNYSSSDLVQPIGGATNGFVLALWDADTAGDYVALSFGTDSSLTVTPGWDNVTGWGSLNMGAIYSLLP